MGSSGSPLHARSQSARNSSRCNTAIPEPVPTRVEAVFLSRFPIFRWWFHLIFTIMRVKVRWHMVSVIHANDNPEEAANFWHWDIPLQDYTAKINEIVVNSSMVQARDRLCRNGSLISEINAWESKSRFSSSNGEESRRREQDEHSKVAPGMRCLSIWIWWRCKRKGQPVSGLAFCMLIIIRGFSPVV